MEVEINNRVFDTRISKYSPANEYLVDSLLNGYLWFSDPANFNDPHDLNLNLILPSYNREKITALVEILGKNGYTRGHKIEDLVEYYIENPSLLQKSMQGYVDVLRSKVGISCFSQTDDNTLMWSHYGDKHAGICLTFDMCRDFDFFKIPVKVDYVTEYPQFDYLELRKNQGDLVQRLAGTKSSIWEYENEIRIAKPSELFKDFREKIPFNKESLIEVTFGYKMKPDSAADLRDKIKAVGYTCKFFKADLKKGAFGLNREIFM